VWGFSHAEAATIIGRFEGAGAELVVGPRTIPHLWALTDDLVVRISGDLTRAELLQAAESLRPVA
jgi:hypothetical protein